MHLGIFPDSMEFQSWKVNFQTEVCSKTADPDLTVQWIKEVEMAKSIDELMTSRSNAGRIDFPDYDMPDAMIASALEKLLDRHVPFRRRVASKSSVLKNTTDSFVRDELAYMIHEHFPAIGAVQGLSDLFNIRLQNDIVQDFDVRWGKRNSDRNGPYKSTLQVSVQPQTVLALHDQETTRNNGQPSCQRLKASVRLHVDQTT